MLPAPVRVAFVCHMVHSRRLGGADRSLVALMDALRRWRVEPLVCVPYEGELTEELRSRGISFKVVAYRNATAGNWSPRGMATRALAGPRLVQGALRLRNAIREWKPHLIYSNSVAVAVGRVTAWIMGLPHVWHLRELPELDRGVSPAWGWRLHRRLINSSDRVVAISEAVAAEFRNGRGRGPLVIYNGIGTRAEFDRWASLRVGGFRRGLKCVLIGGLAPSKGQCDAIRAAARLVRAGREVTLELVGGGDDRDVRRVIEAHRAHDYVHLRGRCASPWAALADADCLLMCSTREPFGRVVVEAMAVGVPVIGRAAGGVVEIIRHGHTGVLYDGSEQGLADAIAWVQDHPSEVARLASEAQREAVSRFSAERCAERVFTEVIEPLCQRRVELEHAASMDGGLAALLRPEFDRPKAGT